MDVIKEKKMRLYEEFYDKMKDIDQEELELYHKSSHYENIEDNFIYLDETRNFGDLHLRDQKIITEQNNLHNYEQLKNRMDNIKNTYNSGKYFLSFAKWIPYI
jgi:hypothetical protein